MLLFSTPRNNKLHCKHTQNLHTSRLSQITKESYEQLASTKDNSIKHKNNKISTNAMNPQIELRQKLNKHLSEREKNDGKANIFNTNSSKDSPLIEKQNLLSTKTTLNAKQLSITIKP